MDALLTPTIIPSWLIIEQDCSEDSWRSKFFAVEHLYDSIEMHTHKHTTPKPI